MRVKSALDNRKYIKNIIMYEKYPDKHSSGSQSGRLSGSSKISRGKFRDQKNDETIAEMIPSGGAGSATWSELAAAVAAYPADAGFAEDLERVNEMDSSPENPWD